MDEININLNELKVSLSYEDDRKLEEKAAEDSDSIKLEANDQPVENDKFYASNNSGEEDDDEMMAMSDDFLESDDNDDYVDSEEDSSDDEELLQVALAIDSSQLSCDGTNSSNNLPINGHDYLRQVQIEREKYPAVSYAKPPPPRLDKQCPPSPWVEMLLSKSNRDGKSSSSSTTTTTPPPSDLKQST